MTSIIKKFLPLTTSLLTLLTIIMLWEYIELPYNFKTLTIVCSGSNQEIE